MRPFRDTATGRLIAELPPELRWLFRVMDYPYPAAIRGEVEALPERARGGLSVARATAILWWCSRRQGRLQCARAKARGERAFVL